MKLGLDFDNTIVCYDGLFHRVAVERGWIPAHVPLAKEAVRNHLRETGREPLWTELQGVIYGSRMPDARPFPGVLDFLARCRRERRHVSIISHRTRSPYLGEPFDLHQAARRWLHDQGLLAPAAGGIAPEDVYLEETKEAKLARIAEVGCTHFVDDLPEFLAEPGFPAGVQRILFDPHHRHEPGATFARAGSWQDVERQIFEPGLAAPEPIRDLLAHAGVIGAFALTPLPGGANNRVVRVNADGFRGVIKTYFRHPGDVRDRLRAEWEFCRFAWDSEVRQVPRPLACDKDNGLALYEYIDGQPVSPGAVAAGDVAAAAEFFRALQAGRDRARHLPAASEACFSLAEHLATVDRRVDRLEREADDPDARRFLQEDLRPTWHRCRADFLAAARSAGVDVEVALSEQVRCISPSDFGFHNALRTRGGHLRFLDFEYAGWDDPAKMICDFFLQPAVPVSIEHRAAFVQVALAADPNRDEHRQRATLLAPVYRVKWCCILLNEFLPAGVARRRFAGAEADAQTHRTRQLAKARSLLHAAQQP